MNLTIVKLLLLLVTAPLWVPFVRALWEEFNEALAEDGGLFGKEPTRREADEIRAEGRADEALVHEPWVRSGDRRRARFPAGRRLGGGGGGGRAGGAAGSGPTRGGAAAGRGAPGRGAAATREAEGGFGRGARRGGFR